MEAAGAKAGVGGSEETAGARKHSPGEVTGGGHERTRKQRETEGEDHDGGTTNAAH